MADYAELEANLIGIAFQELKLWRVSPINTTDQELTW